MEIDNSRLPTGSNGSSTKSVIVSPFVVEHDSLNHQHDSHMFPDTQASSSSEQAEGSSLFGAGFNFVNSIVGAGIIGMPIAIKESGFVMGIFLLVLVAVLIDRSVILLVECGIKAGKTNLEDLTGHLFGRKGHAVATIFMFMYAYGAMVAYMLIIGDTVPVVLRYTFGSDSPSRDVVVLLVALCIILPLCLLRDMSSLAYSSMLSISADFVMILFVLCNAPIAARRDDIQVTSADFNFISYQIFEGIGTFSFAFVCQHNTFIVFDSMAHPTLHNWKKVAHGSLAVAGSMCMTLGLAGYLNFGAQTEGDILNNFSESGGCPSSRNLFFLSNCTIDSLMLGARVLLALTMVFTYPMELFVCRHALVSASRSLLTQERPAREEGDVEGEGGVREGEGHPHGDGSGVVGEVVEEELANPLAATLLTDQPASPAVTLHSDDDVPVDHQSTDMATHVSLTLGLWGSTLLIAVLFKDLRIVLALTGTWPARGDIERSVRV